MRGLLILLIVAAVCGAIYAVADWRGVAGFGGMVALMWLGLRPDRGPLLTINLPQWVFRVVGIAVAILLIALFKVYLGWRGLVGVAVAFALIEGTFRLRYGFWRSDRM